ncbi:MAG: type II CAAX endopeptidase family protein [Myxococcota bacterium]|jgi:membrane protease YdiL (CAAX protease family)|nr:type II CAAX endopeptidase family protein [Myxococcota bacterium]
MMLGAYMRDLKLFLLYLLAVVVVGCLLAPLLYDAAQWLMEAGYLTFLARFRFQKYLNRGILIAALIFMPIFLMSLKMTSWKSLGIEKNVGKWRDLIMGFVFAALSLWLAASVLLIEGQRVWKTNISWFNIGGALLTALTVALIEEVFFRGVLLGVLRRHLSSYRALAILTVIFAALHFIRSPRTKVKIPEVEWHSGFTLLPKSFWQFSEPELILGGLLTLCLVGWILGYTVIKTRSLFMAFGLHAGWVFALRSFQFSTRKMGENNIWFGQNLLTGLAPILLLMLTGILLFFFFSRAESKRTAG